MIQKIEMYTVKCDNCGKLFADEQSGFVAWNEPSGAWENANDSEWLRDGVSHHYCPDCYSYNDEDEIVIKKIESNERS